MSQLRFGLRFKLILLSGFLFAIPWLSYRYVWEMEKYLRQGQENTIMGTARAVATAMHERPKLFDSHASFLDSVQRGRDIYAHQIENPIYLDGRANDWEAFDNSFIHYEIPSVDANAPTNLSFKHIVGKYGRFLYAMFEVQDDSVIYRPKDSLRIDRNDHIKIALINSKGEYQRYIIANTEPGWLNAYQLVDRLSSHRPARPEPRIQGRWLATNTGYNVELRLPLDMLGAKLAFAVADRDSIDISAVTQVVGTADTQNSDQLGTVLVPSPEIEQIIKGMSHNRSRIWVVDRHQRVLAKTGEITESSGIWDHLPQQQESSFWQNFQRQYLHPLYYTVLTPPTKEFIDDLKNASRLEGSHITSALEGGAKATWRVTSDERAVVLSAAYPIYIDNEVMGAVIAEETTNGIRTLRNRALENLFTNMLLMMLAGTVALFVFASRISSRIRRLRNQAEAVMDEKGRIQTTISSSSTRDEIGDLSRSFADLVNRLTQYNQYLEAMSSRLSHELRTPIAVVRSSLEHLGMMEQSDDSQVYIQRAQDGIHRLNTILTQMSEATRLEQALQTSERERFPLNDVVKGVMEGYRMAYPNNTFEVNVPESKLMLDGAPEFIAQLMDKLISNAVDFSPIDQPIIVELQEKKQQAILRIKNQGPRLPENMQEQIFDSMVSVRPEGKQDTPHLGIGLYIARLITQFHRGQIRAKNLADDPFETIQGVEFSVQLPLIKT